jgi:hypothetical protein
MNRSALRWSAGDKAGSACDGHRATRRRPRTSDWCRPMRCRSGPARCARRGQRTRPPHRAAPGWWSGRSRWGRGRRRRVGWHRRRRPRSGRSRWLPIRGCGCPLSGRRPDARRRPGSARASCGPGVRASPGGHGRSAPVRPTADRRRAGGCTRPRRGRRTRSSEDVRSAVPADADPSVGRPGPGGSPRPRPAVSGAASDAAGSCDPRCPASPRRGIGRSICGPSSG